MLQQAYGAIEHGGELAVEGVQSLQGRVVPSWIKVGDGAGLKRSAEQSAITAQHSPTRQPANLGGGVL